MQIYNLKCEGKKKPLNVEAKHPKFSWLIKSKQKNFMQSAYRIIIYDENFKLLHDTKKVVDSNNIFVKLNNFQTSPLTGYYWKVKIWDKDDNQSNFSDFEYFSTGIMNTKWGAKWIGLSNDDINIWTEIEGVDYFPPVYLRKKIKINKNIKKASLYSTALGVYECALNDKRIGDDYFAPGWTDYNKRLMYQAYDITDFFEKGENIFDVIVADGWYTGNIAISGRKQYGDYPLLFSAVIKIEYEDDGFDTIITDESWEAGTKEIVYSDFQKGEKVDKRITEAEYTSVYCKKLDIIPIAQIDEGIKVVEEIYPKDTYFIDENKLIIDFGQNFAGFVYLSVKGEKGETITIRHGEMLNLDKSLYTKNLRTADSIDTYILNGEEIEELEPKFTFHGFRYIEITADFEKLKIDTIIGKAIMSTMKETFKFESSSKMVNKLFSNIYWSLRSNFISLPTDCPQRDERMGWTGDGQIFAKSGMYLCESYNFYKKWYNDILDAQKETGAYTDVAPNVVIKSKNKDLVGNGNGAWADAGVIIPWEIYEMFADKDVLVKAYPSAKKWINYLKKNSNNYLRPKGPLGDWLNVDEKTDLQLMETAYFAHSVKIYSNILNEIELKEEKKEADKLFSNIKKAYNEAFVDSNFKIKSNSQTAYLISIAFELIDKENIPSVMENLVLNLKEKNYHLSTGFVGVKFLLPILSEHGYNDIAYKLLLNETYPSWGYTIKNGATTIWERWNSFTKEKGFGDEKMNSFNHYSLGSVSEWMIRYMVGIEKGKNQAGFSNFNIKPRPYKSIQFVKGEFDSVYGKIESSWKFIDENKIKFNITIPPNTNCKFEYEDTKKELGSGKYEFII